MYASKSDSRFDMLEGKVEEIAHDDNGPYLLVYVYRRAGKYMVPPAYRRIRKMETVVKV